MGPVGHEGRFWHGTPGRCTGAEEGAVSCPTNGEVLADECEAFLSGSFADLQGSRRRPVEAWAWVNRVAHAEPEEVKALAARSAVWRGRGFWRGGLRTRRWKRAVSDIARDLVSLSEGKPRVIRRLQARALVPLELELAAMGRRYRVTPEVLVVRARGALYRSRSRTYAEVLPSSGRYFDEPRPAVWPASGARERTRNIGVALFLVAVVGGFVVLGSASRAAPSASSSLYSYYVSRLASLDNRSLDSVEAFAWIEGGKGAPGWEVGRDLPTFLLPWRSDAVGSYIGWLFAGAPGPLAKGARAYQAGTAMPAGARVDIAANTIRFSRLTVGFEVAALSGHHFRIAGLSNPTVVVPAGATVHIELVDDDTTSAHGLAVVPVGAGRSSMPMAVTKPAFLGSALWFLGDATVDGAHEGVVSFKAAKPGTYEYLDPVPGEAKGGMTGTFEVVEPEAVS